MKFPPCVGARITTLEGVLLGLEKLMHVLNVVLVFHDGIIN